MLHVLLNKIEGNEHILSPFLGNLNYYESTQQTYIYDEYIQNRTRAGWWYINLSAESCNVDIVQNDSMLFYIYVAYTIPYIVELMAVPLTCCVNGIVESISFQLLLLHALRGSSNLRSFLAKVCNHVAGRVSSLLDDSISFDCFSLFM